MKRIYLYIIIFALVFPFVSISAQRKTKKGNAKNEVVDPRIERMVAATQDIIVVDSIVVNKAGFLSLYNLNPESGRLMKYQELFNDDKQTESFVHINEMGHKCYYSKGDTINGTTLFTSDKFDNKWSQGYELEGLRDGEKIKSLNYPFMMADGTTLYFSAKGTESIGGYDIFVSRLDIETGKYLKPENIGMPFNSTANDYMYAIDELDSIGWFVTDRNQPEGKVCIYIFIPSETRQTYSPDEYTEEQIKNFSRIYKISNTWKDGDAHLKAKQRLANISLNKGKQKDKGDFYFVINDKNTYTKLSDFRSTENATRFSELLALKSKHNLLGNVLEKARIYFSTASIQEKTELRTEILRSEKQYESMEIEIEKMEKEIRNSENNLLK